MSQVGRKPINIPVGVEMKIGGNVVTVKEAKGTPTQQFHPSMMISQEGDELVVTRPNDEKEDRALHGLTRTLVRSMVVGVTEGFKKELDALGAGCRMQKQGKNLVMNLGYSHWVIVSETDEVQIGTLTSNKIIIHGIGKQKAGQLATEVREKRPPESYKGRGIRYAGEFVRRKEGKIGKGSKK